MIVAGHGIARRGGDKRSVKRGRIGEVRAKVRHCQLQEFFSFDLLRHRQTLSTIPNSFTSILSPKKMRTAEMY